MRRIERLIRVKSSSRLLCVIRSRWLRNNSTEPIAAAIGVRNSWEVTEMNRLFISETWRSFSSIPAASVSRRFRAVMSRTKTTNSSAPIGEVRSSTASCPVSEASEASADTVLPSASAWAPLARTVERSTEPICGLGPNSAAKEEFASGVPPFAS